MINVKKIIANFLAVSLLMGTASIEVKAVNKDGIVIPVTEAEGSLRIDGLEITPHELEVKAPYDNNEFVTVIVEMEESPLMDYYTNSSYFYINEDDTPGELVSNFLTSEDARNASDEIISNQQGVISEIKSLLNNEEIEIARTTETVEVVDNWSIILNGIAVRVPYGLLDEIRDLDGVKRAYVENIYDSPEPVSVVEDGKGSFSYSLDMVGVEETWATGYTGKEMLVAILDTGLDIKIDWNGNVVREHEAFTEESFYSGDPDNSENGWNLRYTDESIEDFLSENQLNATTGSGGSHITYDNNGLYKNIKVPFACDYADGDINVLNLNSNHGTHVSGTVAGFVSTEEGEIKFSGVAPDAQILAMKVFSDVGGGAAESCIINALEDSLKLGADVINLSLGSNNGFSDDDTFQGDMYRRLNDAGVILATSAGNSDKSSEGNNYNGNNTTANPDESMISSPAVYNSNLSVASMENTINVQPYLTWVNDNGDKKDVSFNDPWSGLMKTVYGGNEYPVYAVDGYGTYSDYYNVGFNNGYNSGKTGFALVKRGEISFVDKINNAMSFSGVNSQGERYGVLGVIVYDNDPDGTDLITMSVSGTALYSAFISGKDGNEMVNLLKNGKDINIIVAEEDKTIDNPVAGEMSSFTSWGAGPGLELKPEITAPGGKIWSTIVGSDSSEYTGDYGMMSGTSMAAPHITGISTLIRQRVISESVFEGIEVNNISDVVSQLLVSTAVPAIDTNGIYYSPRRQGAGLVNSAAAAVTPAYITVDGKKVGKLELGDDPSKLGNLDINFNLNNISNDDVKYNVEVVLMIPDTESVESAWGNREVILDNNEVIKTISLGEISATAGNTTAFNEVVSLSEAEKAKLDSTFENGVYVEGYVILTDSTENRNPQLGLPLLSFYGDWTKSPIFDSSLWIDEPLDGENVFNNESNWYSTALGSTQYNDLYGIIGFYTLGQNIFDETSTMGQLIYEKDNITLSPNGDEYFDRIDLQSVYQIRDAKAIVLEVTDAETGEVYAKDWSAYSSKTLYSSDIGAAMPYSAYGSFPSWYGTDMDGNILPSGTKCIYTLTAYGEGDYGDKIYNDDAGKNITDFDSIIPGENEPTFNGHVMDKSGDVITFPVNIDTVSPKLENNAVTFYEKDGRTYITGTVYDEDGSIASVEIVPHVSRTYANGYGDPDYIEYGLDRVNPFLVENIYDPAIKEFTFTVDVTEYSHSNESYEGENNYYNYNWTGNIIISCGDYGVNDRSYILKVDSTDGIVLSQTSALLGVGSKFELSVNNNTSDLESEITRVSSNTDVATIDEFGVVTAVAPGQSLITVSNGTSSAICVVAVEERTAQIESFDLSIDKFAGLKPEGSIVVKVDNVQPANASISDIKWEIIEDDDFVEQYGSGLVKVGKYSGDSLSGLVELVASNSYDLVPGGKVEIIVTIGGISKSMEVQWEDLYQDYYVDDLVSMEYYSSQTIYINQGDSVPLKAKYRQGSKHNISDVVAELKGAKLDGADFFYIGGNYQCKLVNDEGYSLPEDVNIYIEYSTGNRVEMVNYPYYTYYTYNSMTGDININYTPNGADNKIVIVADGIESEGIEAGVVSEKNYEKPDSLYGPFDWTIKDGNGELTIGNVEVYGDTIETAIFTPSSPGVNYITATTKDGKYSLEFAVISEAVKADTIKLDTNSVDIEIGESISINSTLSPTPTLGKDEELKWTSFAPEVATVSEDGIITGVSEGYAYMKVESVKNCNVISYCIVSVNDNSNKYTVKFVDFDGTVLKEEIVQEGNSAVAPENPVRDGYKFIGWDVEFDNIIEDLIITAKYSKNDDEDDKTEDGNGNDGETGNSGGSNENGSGNNQGTNNGGSGNSGSKPGSSLPITGAVVGSFAIVIISLGLIGGGVFTLRKKK